MTATNKGDWALLKALFQSALERTGAEQLAFVARASQDHPRLAEQLRALLASHCEASGFLNEPAFAGAALTDLEAFGTGPDRTGTVAVGDILDNTYDLDAILGNGGMGVVYRAYHRAQARSFAAKVIHSRFTPDPTFLARFSREAEALGKLKHPHIVDVTDFGIDRGATVRPYLIMEYLEGQTLQERLRTGPLAPDAALPIFERIAAAIDHAHEHGVLHLDLKPGNIILVDEANGPPVPKILDFGLAGFLTAGSDPGRTEQPIGTPSSSYMAPEIRGGKRPKPSADIYSFAVLMHEVLTGHRPFDGLVPTVNAEAAASLAPALARDRTARPATARATVALVRDAALEVQQRLWRRTEIPRRVGAAAGIAFTLMLMSQLLWESPPMRLLATGTVSAVLCGAVLLVRDASRAVLTVILAGATCLLGAVLLFWLSNQLLPIAPPLVMCGVGSVIALAIRRRRAPFPQA